MKQRRRGADTSDMEATLMLVALASIPLAFLVVTVGLLADRWGQ